MTERWRLILGEAADEAQESSLSAEQLGMDQALAALYEFEERGRFDYPAEKGQGGAERSRPAIARWLGDIRRYFPQSVVQVIQADALKNPELQKKMMFEPEMLEAATPDIYLAATLIELGKLIPAKTKDSARMVIRKVVDDLTRRLEYKTIQALNGALQRGPRKLRPKFQEIDWPATIRKNLRHYQPAVGSIIPETLIGHARKNRRSLKDVVLCIDQSGSMASSVVYSAIFGAVMANMPTLRTRMVAFDTAVVDLSEQLKDPVELLFGVQLGGGTDIGQALQYCRGLIDRPNDTILVLISDLYEGGKAERMRSNFKDLVDAGVYIIVLLALNDDGAPGYDRQHAQFLARLSVPVFACTPDAFPEVMANAIRKK